MEAQDKAIEGKVTEEKVEVIRKGRALILIQEDRVLTKEKTVIQKEILLIIRDQGKKWVALKITTYSHRKNNLKIPSNQIRMLELAGDMLKAIVKSNNLEKQNQ